MDDNSSFDESCNFYSNAARKLNESDDEDSDDPKKEENPPKVEAPKIETKSEEVSAPVFGRQQRRQQQRQNVAPVNRGGRRRGRGRPRRAASFQSSYSFDSSNDGEMLTVIDINDDSPISSSHDKNMSDFDADEGEIVWSSDRTTADILSDGLSDPDLSISGIEEAQLEVDVVVRWKFREARKFSIKKLDIMKGVFKQLAEAEGVPESQICLTHRGQQISPYDTPEKLKTTAVIILEGTLRAANKAEQQADTIDPNQIELKVSLKDKREKLSIVIFRNEPLEVFMEKTADQLKVPLSNLRFEFDGEALDKSETPTSMDLEGGECIEVFVRS